MLFHFILFIYQNCLKVDATNLVDHYGWSGAPLLPPVRWSHRSLSLLVRHPNWCKLTGQHGERVCIKFIALSFELFQTSWKNPLAAAIASICDQTMAFCSQSVLCAVLCECFKEFWQNTLKVVFSSGDGSSILFFYVGVSYITFPVSVSFWLCHSPCYVRWSIFTLSRRWLDKS